MISIEELEQPNKLKVDDEGRVYREIRCTQCRTWLADEYLYSGRLVLKCPRCGAIMRLKFKHIREKSKE